MTSTETIRLDPLGVDATMVGRRPNAVAGRGDYNSSIYGIWTESRYTWCAAEDPGRRGACSRPNGHPTNWAHCAATNGEILAVWGGTAVGSGPVDPNADVAIRSYVADCRNYSDGFSGIYVNGGGRSTACGVSDPASSWVCTRAIGHPVTWDHIACDSSRVLAKWGKIDDSPMVDPYAGVTPGESGQLIEGWDTHYGTRRGGVTGRREHWCNRPNPLHAEGTCTRIKGHSEEWACIATGGDPQSTVLWVMTKEERENPPNPDPEDGSPADDAATVITTAPDTGAVLKLRDRLNRLYVMRMRVGGREVEVIDLTKNELRAIPLDKIVPLPEDQAVLTVAELGMVAKWFAANRDTVRRVAVREYRNDRWCMEGLNESLRDMGMEKYVPQLHGWIRISVPFDCDDTGTGASVIERTVSEVLANPEVSAALRVALPPIDGIEINPAGLTVSAADFHRK